MTDRKPNAYGILIHNLDSGRVEMFADLFKTEQECDYTISMFKKLKVMLDKNLMKVEVYVPVQDEQPQDQPEPSKEEKAEEPVPEQPRTREEIERDLNRASNPVEKWKDRMHRETYKSNPDGTVDVEIDGEKITDPEKQKEAKERLDHMFDDIMKGWPWFEQLGRKGIDPPSKEAPVQEPVRPDPLQVSRYTPWWGILDPFTGEPLNPIYCGECVAKC